MKRLGKKILIFTCVLVVALAVAEFVTRAVVLSRSGGTSFEAYRLRCLGENIPIFEQDAEGELIDCKPSLSQGKRIHISSQGFRGKDVVDPKPTDTFRICFIGGSGCFGTTSSNDDSTIPAFFGARVRENAASPEKVDVINGGLPGATTYMSVNRYEKRLARFNPDIVILYNLVNDLLTSRRARLGIDPRTWPAVKITGTLSSWLSHSAMWLVFETARSNHYKRLRIEQVTKSDEKEHWADRREHSKKMREELDSIVGEEKIHVYDGKIENNIYIVPEHFAQFREELRRFHRVVSASGATPVFCTFAFRFTGEETVEEYRKVGPGIAMYMPDWNMARDAMRAMNDAIREVARETNSVLCDVDRELVREPGDYPEKDTDHFTDAGCAKVGALIAKVLQDQQLLQGASRPK